LEIRVRPTALILEHAIARSCFGVLQYSAREKKKHVGDATHTEHITLETLR
jgi:hypothetical protein